MLSNVTKHFSPLLFLDVVFSFFTSLYVSEDISEIHFIWLWFTQYNWPVIRCIAFHDLSFVLFDSSYIFFSQGILLALSFYNISIARYQKTRHKARNLQVIQIFCDGSSILLLVLRVLTFGIHLLACWIIGILSLKKNPRDYILCLWNEKFSSLVIDLLEVRNSKCQDWRETDHR